ncbi:OsmC family protein [Peredibacter starrii]|uniref:OsmC family protein n=1 Tax=Peredibacter starrii TaxID=28202 RepID=A0AAX4HTM8_9BACT|nr:OsmC family protein [Peredibacter starrii]WPU66552.1 OsmC family protein [Peredibacter starrii]
MIIGNRQGTLAADLHTRNHQITAGLSEKIGGNDEGMNPHQIIEAGLTACTILTCQMYADKKKWPLTNTKVTVKITTEEVTGAVFQRDIVFEGDLTDEQKEKLLAIANKTPIYNLLTRSISIDTKLV